uniref:Uncharacterized protein n=1 Tax=Lepeophtheirus salmonis TaxID=72036 RepID=A0A0K2V300_LEPSM
MCQCTYYNDH